MKKNKLIIIAFGIAPLGILLNGCGPTMFNVNIKSNPEGADVKIFRKNSKMVVFKGKTPVTASLIKHSYGGWDRSYTMQIYKYGYVKKFLPIAPIPYFNSACEAGHILYFAFLPIDILSGMHGGYSSGGGSSCGHNAWLTYHTHYNVKLKQKKWLGLWKSKKPVEKYKHKEK
jgi:hypothetical protein